MSSLKYSNILVLGLSGSGKSFISEKFNDLGWNIISAGDVLRDICSDLEMSTDRKTLRQYGKRILKEKGITYFADLLINKKCSTRCNVFEGIRSLEVIQIIKKKLDCMILFIDCSSENRLERLKTRDNLSFSEYNELEEDIYEQQVYEMKKYADIIINNNLTKDELEKQLISLKLIDCKKTSNKLLH